MLDPARRRNSVSQRRLMKVYGTREELASGLSDVWSLRNRYQESEFTGIQKSPFSLRDCLGFRQFAFWTECSARTKLWHFQGWLHHAEDADRGSRILCDAECCRRCRSASQAAAASGACSGWQGSDRQDADREISAAGAARSDQGLTVLLP